MQTKHRLFVNVKLNTTQCHH